MRKLFAVLVLPVFLCAFDVQKAKKALDGDWRSLDNKSVMSIDVLNNKITRINGGDRTVSKIEIKDFIGSTVVVLVQENGTDEELTFHIEKFLGILKVYKKGEKDTPTIPYKTSKEVEKGSMENFHIAMKNMEIANKDIARTYMKVQ